MPEPNGSKSETKRAALLLDKIMFAVQKVDIIPLEMDPQLSTFFGQKKENYGVFSPIEDSPFLKSSPIAHLKALDEKEKPGGGKKGSGPAANINLASFTGVSLDLIMMVMLSLNLMRMMVAMKSCVVALRTLVDCQE